MVEEVKNVVVVMYGSLPWRKNLHGSLDPPYLVKNVKKMVERESGAEERERESVGVLCKLMRRGDIYSGEKGLGQN